MRGFNSFDGGWAARAALWLVACCMATPACFGGAVSSDGSLGGRAGPLAKDAAGVFSVAPTLGRQVGQNLFYSLGQFNLDKGETAAFSGPSSVHNVLTRVTGGTPSNINGTLRCTIPQADFYLINPAGVVFGPDAVLDVQGSFAVTTADYVRLVDGTQFNASLSQPPVLTTVGPAAFGFLNANPAGISVQGKNGADAQGNFTHSPTLTPAPGKALLIVGGKLQVAGGAMQSNGGPLAVASVASAGEAKLGTSGPAGGFDVNSFSRLGSVSVSEAGFLSSAGTVDGGPVSVSSGDVKVDGSSAEISSTGGSGRGGDVRVSASEQVSISGGLIESSGVMDAGTVSVSAAGVALNGGAISSTGVTGRGGDVSVLVAGPLSLSAANVQSLGGTDGGAVTVSAASVTFINGSSSSVGGGGISSRAGGGQPGAVRVSAPGAVQLVGNASIAGRSVSVSSGSLSLDSGFISGDELQVSASGPVTVSGGSIFSNPITGLVSVSATGPITGSGFGSISGGATLRVSAPSVTLRGSFVIFASDVQVSASGPVSVGGLSSIGGGSVLVSAGSADIDGGSISSSAGTGQLGGVLLSVPGPVSVRGGGSVNAFGEAGANPVTIQSQSLLLNGGTVLSGTLSSGSGDVHIRSGSVRLSNGAAIAAVTGAGLGGSVDVQAADVSLDGRGQGVNIYTASFGTGGKGGDVRVAAATLEQLGFASIGAGSLGSGEVGTVHVDAGAVNADAAATAPHVVLKGLNGQATILQGPQYRVPAELGVTRGGNLFQSFSRVALAPFESIDFSGPPTVQRVIAGTVAGGQIDGLVRCSIADADVYLLSPTGLAFHPGAMFDIRGSLALSTADFVRLGTSGRFDVRSPAVADLTADTPLSFGFATGSPAGIHLLKPAGGTPGNGPMLIPGPGKGLLVVGGALDLVGGVLQGSGGPVTVAAVDSAGEARLGPDGLAGGLDLSSFARLGPLTLSGAGFIGTADTTFTAPVSVSCSSLTLSDQGGISAGGGELRVSTSGPVRISESSLGGGSLSISSGSLSLDGGQIQSTGNVTVSTTGQVSITNSGFLFGSPVSVSAAGVSLDGAGSSQIAAGSGTAVTVSSSGPVSLGGGTSIGAFGVTDDVSVSVSARSVTVHGGSISSAAGTGRTGDVSVSASELVSVSEGGIIGTLGFNGATAGSVSVSAGSVAVEGTEGRISSSASFGGNAGDVRVVASGQVLVTNGGNIESDTDSVGLLTTGRAGDVYVSTSGPVTVSAGSTIGSVGASGGRSGRVTVSGGDVILDGAGSTLATGILSSGKLLVSPGSAALSLSAETLTMRHGAFASADSFGTDTAGTVDVTVGGAAALADGATVSARSFNGGDGGNLTFHAGTLSLSGAVISASSFRGGAGGRVDVSARTVTIDRASSIASTGGGGLAQPLTAGVAFVGPVDTLNPTGNVSLISPAGTRVQLSTAVSDERTYSDSSADDFSLTQPAGFLSNFVAKDLNGTWRVEVQNAHDVTTNQPALVTLSSWSLSLGGTAIGSSSTRVSGTSFDSPLTVSGAEPGLTAGRGGDVHIATSKLRVSGGSTISTGTVGTDPAGALRIDARTVSVTGAGSAIQSTSPTAGGAGSITVNASSRAAITHGGSVSVSAGNAPGGDIAITAGRQLLVQHGSISAEVDPQSLTKGGNIFIKSGRIQIEDSTISAKAGKLGGQITIDPPVVILQNSEINGLSAGTPVQVRFPGDVALLRSGSRILTQSLTLPPEIEVAGSLVALPRALASPTVLLPKCGLELGGNVSSFIVTGQGGTPVQPGGWIPDLDLRLFPSHGDGR